MKKLISILFITSIILSACGAEITSTVTAENAQTEKAGSTSTQESSVPAPSRLEVNEEALRGLEITVWTPWHEVEQSLFESFVNQFNKENQWGIQVDLQSQVNFSNLYETVNASLPTDERPDLVIALPEHAHGWFDDGVAINLNKYVDDAVYGFDTSDIPDVFWNQDLAGDARVGIPAQRTAQFLLWNQTWANELGFKSAPESTDDFRKQVCEAHESKLNDELAQNDALGGWLVNTEAMTAYSWLLAFDGGVLEEENFRFMKPNNIDAFRFLRGLSESNCAWQNATDPILSFANREALFITASLEELPNVSRVFANVGNRDDWRVTPFPNDDDGVMAVYGSSYVVMKSNDERQIAAWLFIKWLLDNKQDARLVETTHLFPLRSSTLDLLGDYERTHLQWRQAVDLISQGELQPQLASWRIVKIMLGDGFAHMYRVNTPSGQVAAILAQMENTARDLSE
ncbi:MAG: extracellular solute-binding protein [Anaerolineales bacterium]|nr:extracellular solute-binding protein [Anaerolineales bacterium]